MSIDRDQVVFALQRQHSALEQFADQLHRQRDYSAEFPAEDAERLAEAIMLIRSIAPTEVLLIAVRNERARQDAKWGGASHDDKHSPAEFVQLIEDYAGWARTMAGMGNFGKARHRLVQVAALAVACCEAIDRAEARVAAQL